jgi:hypothetical protein
LALSKLSKIPVDGNVSTPAPELEDELLELLLEELDDGPSSSLSIGTKTSFFVLY